MLTYTDLTPHQKTIFDGIRAALKRGQNEVMLTGLAGSGKSTLLAILCEELNMIPCSYTARAAFGLAEKCHRDPSTIHKLLYIPVEVKDPKTGEKVLTFKKNEKGYGGEIIAVDESSMVSKRIRQDLYDTGAQVLGCGDPGQLPPVKAEAGYDWSDFHLNEIMRQALDSPIIRQAHGVRNNGRYGNDTGDFRSVQKISTDELLAADVRIVWKNQTRMALNAKLRKMLGYTASHPMKGEPLVCLHNCPTYGVYNGIVYTLLEDFDIERDREIHLDVGGDHVSIPFVDLVHDRKDMRDGKITCFDLGYVLTCHKCQGSEWDNVAIIDEHRIPHERRRWLYTGITRAKQSIVIQHQ